MKRALTIQDISCIGKCSLGVALPVISAMGVETAVLPTALLSSHTAFQHFSIYNLTQQIPAIVDAWREEDICFDTIYSGYLGSVGQIALVRQVWRTFPKTLQQERNGHVLHLVDPAMADNGNLYKGFDTTYVKAMQKLCGEADIIVPNLTEACLLTGEAYSKGMSSETARDLLKKLGEQGSETVILTGYSEGENTLGALVYEREKDVFFSYVNERLPGEFHGTGDVFASVVCGAITLGKDIKEAVQLAVDFVQKCLTATLKDEKHRWYGVNFEEAIPWLCRKAAEGDTDAMGLNGL